MPVYRYKFSGIDPANLVNKVPGSITVGDTAPSIFIDVTADTSAKEDLDLVMAGENYLFDSTDPVTTTEQQTADESSVTLTPLNKGMDALATASDGVQASSTAVLSSPPIGSWISVYVNGISYKVGNGTKVGVPCYFSGDGGATARATDIIAGDYLYWNGSVAGFQLETSDRIDFVFQAP